MPVPDFARIVYTTALHAAHLATPVAAIGDGKVARSIRARRDAVARLCDWGVASRDPSRPLIWFHAPSVGEGLQARAVLEEARELLADAQWVFTHFSPSAEKLAASMPADFHGYLPWDLPGNWRRVLAAVRPSAIVFTKTEIWPNLVRAATAARIPTALTAATLPETSSRLKWPTRSILRQPLSQLAAVQAIGQADAEGFRSIGAQDAAISVTGDPGIDSAVRRARTADPQAPWLAPFHATSAPTVVAGSTWGECEVRLRPALRAARDQTDGLRIVIAPHEPTPGHTHPLIEGLEADGWRVATLAEVEADGAVGEANAIVVDRVGVLAGLYTIGTVAYVGGGFGSAGLHSVLEPAAAGIPTVVGPNYRSSAAAIDMLKEGGVRSVQDADGLAAVFAGWLGDPEQRASDGESAGRYIDRHSGAARTSADGLLSILSQSHTSNR